VGPLEEQLASHGYPLVFADLEGRAFRPARARTALYRIEQAAGLRERVTPHGFRHSYATLALAAGVDLAYVSWALGHSTTALTANVYSRPVREAQQRGAALFGGLLAPPAAPSAPQMPTDVPTDEARPE
jgi:site-specific recombinase XerD